MPSAKANLIYGTKPTPQAPTTFAAYRRSQSVKIPQEDRTALPILGKPEMESKLVKHIMDRVTMSDPARNRRADRAQMIDVQLSGFIKLSKDDMKRAADNVAGKAAKPTDHNLPLAEAQIDECMTYLMSVYAPEMDFFEAVAPADKQSMAQAMVAELNKQSQKGQYYRHFAKGLLNMLKYNIGGWTALWERRKGIVFKGSPGGAAKKENGVVWQGNIINSLDIYNTFYDESVHPVDLPEQGEYFAWVERKTPFRVQKMRQDGQLYGIDRYINEVIDNTVGSADGKSFYKQPPSVRDEKSIRENGTINWSATLRGTEVQESAPGLELMTFIGWIKPGEFGLDKADNKNLELWRVVIGNSKCVTAAFKIEDSHGMLPLAIGCPLEDDLKNEQRTYAEKLLPLQHFSSFLLNSHQAAVRKSIYGFTVFVQSLFPGLDLERDDLIGAMIPMRSSAGDIDIDKAIRHYDTSPKTDRNVDMLMQIDGIMQKILPTDLVRNVADLERATMYQAAATVQAGNRRQLKVARIISDQALAPMKFQMIYNCYANLESISFVDEATGERVTKSMGDIVDAQIEFEIGTGLKGLDRLMTIQILRDVLQAVIQSPQAIAEIDIVELLNYFMTLAGDRTDLRQFKRKTPMIDPATGQPVQPQASNANIPQIPATGGNQG